MTAGGPGGDAGGAPAPPITVIILTVQDAANLVGCPVSVG